MQFRFSRTELTYSVGLTVRELAAHLDFEIVGVPEFWDAVELKLSLCCNTVILTITVILF